MSTVITWDLETCPFAPQQLAPEPVCLAADFGDGQRILVASCDPAFDDVLYECITAPMQANTNIAFDMSVILAHRPYFSAEIWKAYHENRVTDLIVREKLLVLADTGDLEFMWAENGAKKRIGFSQLEMEKRHLGVDRSADKDDEDAPRRLYGALLGKPISEYPEDFINYPLQDATYAREIYLKQEEIAKTRDGLGAQFLNTRAALALQLNSCWGFAVDREAAQEMFDELSKSHHERNYPLLLSSGIVRPSVPTRPHARMEPKAMALIGNRRPVDWEPFREKLEAEGIKFKEPEAASRDIKKLRACIAETCKTFEIPPVLTETGEISYGEDMMTAIQGLDPTIDEYIAREETSKLVSTELPRMLHESGIVHPKYDILKKTSRTSSFGNRKSDKNPPYPAVNIQQIDPRVRSAYKARPGHVLCSIDYNFIELVSAAQICLDLFGESVLADMINAGRDPHAFLGGIIRRMFDETWQGDEDPIRNYELFIAGKKTDPAGYKHYRTLAKPTGLGFPGGLGARRFVGYAKATFGVDIVKLAGSLEAAIEMAKKLQAVWKLAFPEMPRYFEFVNKHLVDPQWTYPGDVRYCYQSPHGTIRRNCVYTEATNGFALQTRTAEGAKIALWMLAREMYDDTLGSCLLGVKQVAFVHDEVILEIPEDEHMHERAYRAAHVMIDGMRQVMPDVKVGAEPALMYRWNKAAEAVFDSNNRLKVWKP